MLSALGPRGNGPTTIYREGARAIVTAMSKAGVRRLMICSAAGAFADAGDGVLIRRVVKPVVLDRILKNAFTDLRQGEKELRASDLDWTIVRPPRLTDGEATGRYRTAVDLNVRGGRKIARADLAACMLGLIANDSVIHHHVSVAY